MEMPRQGEGMKEKGAGLWKNRNEKAMSRLKISFQKN